jgi:hypothetical protein
VRLRFPYWRHRRPRHEIYVRKTDGLDRKLDRAELWRRFGFQPVLLLQRGGSWKAVKSRNASHLTIRGEAWDA